ncbi:MAG: hypothetical protein PHT84_00090 [Candidatus Pacebacteria bacterium]|nr:hypothetical protein [Candidatus Paceibacterota bacterium]
MHHDMILTREQAEGFVKEQYDKHIGEWITIEAIQNYQMKAKLINIHCNEDIGEVRDLRIEFQAKYGLTTLEAINLLNGMHVTDYLQKYYRIQNKIALQIKEINKK